MIKHLNNIRTYLHGFIKEFYIDIILFTLIVTQITLAYNFFS